MAAKAGDLEEGGNRAWLSRIFRSNAAEQGTRVLTFPHVPHAHTLQHPHGGQTHFRGNGTSTTKYTLLSFLPKSLFEQYRRVANIYFTINAALSLTPYSPVRPWTTFLPLGLVLGIAMIKEAVEDYKRYRQDVEVNNRQVEVFDSCRKQFVIRTWADVQVGDVITVFKDEYFPADLLFLSAENEDGLCYIETMQLDGETNLKIKKALDETKHLTKDTLCGLSATVRCEPPNSRLYHFTGNLEMHSPLSAEPLVVPVPPAAVLLRGCSLRNTSKVYGLVLYAGHDTKIFMNSTQPPSKRSHVERTVDRIIFFMFSLLFAMCLVGCIYFASWTANQMPSHWYLDPKHVPREYDPAQPVVVAITNFITAFILYSYLIPISLYVSIEMVKVVQAFVFIGHDRQMYHAETDTPAVARTSNLNEELGMVNTVLTDKTGTLTRNVMEFFKASIGGVSYGAGITEIERANALRRGIQIDGGEGQDGSPLREDYFNFYDERLMGRAWAAQPNPHLAREFFRMLALCHTVIPDGPDDPKCIRYEAESPDEAALVVAAKVFGFFFFKRTNTTLKLRESLPEGVQEVEYEVLNILEFNSTRKRMSVVLRSPENRILLYCKGADTVIYERLAKDHPTNEALREVTLQHMEDYGSAGLRTLCLAYKELDAAFYDQWQERYIEAKTSMEDRQSKVDIVSEEIENDLVLLGCTAIEDKLQEGVPQCIKALADADIRLWVLTGDKMETAINIGYACSLITDEMTQFQVTGHSPEVELLEYQGLMEDAMLLAGQHVQSELERVARNLSDDLAAKLPVKYALVIDGKALLYALSPMLRDMFLQVSLKCSAVVCCRVSPLQKAQVTALVKSYGDITLAIGDGANDVGMIQKAHIGVGISGQEGMQAVMAADFAIAQFRFLTPLLLVHGRLSYKRITRMILFFFYKNLMFGITIFIYNAFALFSGQPIYNDFYMTLFNVVFTATAPLVVGWFDRDLDKNYGARFPLLYREGQRNIYFNLQAITGWLFTAVLHAIIILASVMKGADPTEMDRFTGHPLALSQEGILMFSIVIVTVHAQLATVIDHWTWMHHASCWGSIALWFLFILAYGGVPIQLAAELYKLFVGTIANSMFFWLTVIAVAACCVLPTWAARQLQRYLRPAYYQAVQEIAARERAGEVVFEGTPSMHGSAAGRAAPGLMARASRLMQRKVLKASQSSGGAVAAVLRRRYSGFVPPYEARSRVFDSNELRASAAAAGYTISTTGEIIAPPPARAGTVSGALSLSSGTSTGAGAAPGELGQMGVGGFSLPPSPAAHGARASAAPLGTGVLARALSGMGAISLHRRTGSAGSSASLPQQGFFLTSSSGAAEPGSTHHATTSASGSAVPPVAHLSRLSVGTGTGGSLAQTSASGAAAGGSLWSTQAAVPQVARDDTYAGNPVLATLEREFSRDPRRHKHAGKLSLLSVTALPRIRSRSPKLRLSRGGSPTSRPSSGGGALGLRTASFESMQGAEGEAGPGAHSARLEAGEEVQLTGAVLSSRSLDGACGSCASGGGSLSSSQQLQQLRPGLGCDEAAGPSQGHEQHQHSLQPPTYSQQQRPSGTPSRLLRMAARADPPPAAHPAQSDPGAARVRPLSPSASAAQARSAADETGVVAEIQTEDPAMIQLYVAALHNGPRDGESSRGGGR